jgi:hypothetical protein
MSASVAAQLAPLQTQLDAQGQQLATQGQQLADIASGLAETRALACMAYNAQCAEGGARPYVAVPNAAGALAPAGEAPLTSRDALMSLTMPRASAWCVHYGVAPASPTLATRRRAVAAQLGVAPGMVD